MHFYNWVEGRINLTLDKNVQKKKKRKNQLHHVILTLDLLGLHFRGIIAKEFFDIQSNVK